MIKSLQKW